MQFSYKSVCQSILIQNVGKKSLEVISQKMWPKWPSYGIIWHHMAIFNPILTNEYTKMTSSSIRIEWNKMLSSISLLAILVFGPHFLLQGLTWQCCTYGLKTTLKLLVHVLAIMANSCLKISQKSEPPPP